MPNYISTIWILMCVKVALKVHFPVLNIIDYAIWGIALAQFLISNDFSKISAEKTDIFKLFILIAFVQIIGLYKITTPLSIRNIISTLVVGVFLNNAMFYKGKIQIGYIRAAYFAMILALLVTSQKAPVEDNTMAGSVAFALFAYILFELGNHLKRNYVGILSCSEWGLVLIALGSSLVIIFISAARTALAVVIIMMLTFFGVNILRLTPKKSKALMLVFGVVVVMCIITYINISNVSWYEKVNVYSQQLFGKNINSSRPYLWKYSLDSLHGMEIVLGKGTGMLPEIARYATSSFHNSFIQIVMQNGVVGLSLLVAILVKLWNIYSKAAENVFGRFMFSVIVCVITYNCFETTLLQNKAFLGSIQWLILGLGVNLINYKAKKDLKEMIE